MNQEKLYLAGFNHGYIMAQHTPELLAKIVNDVRPTGGYFVGFLSGKRQYEQERARALVQEFDAIRQLNDRARDREV